MKNKHTQGEWKAVLYGDGCRIVSDRYGAIAQIPHEGKHKEEHEANAKLIASAPKLLEVLSNILNIGSITSQMTDYAFNEAIAVIKEATE